MPANIQLSPGVVVLERDLTTVTSVQQGNVGVLAGPFLQGPVNDVVEVTSEQELLEYFGPPDDYNYEYWYTAAQFIGYGGLLKTVRTDASALKNAVSNGTATPPTALKCRNLQEYETVYEDAPSGNLFTWISRTPGTLANSLRVFITDAGPDWIAVLPAPASGDEWKFTSGASLSAAAGGSGATGKVYNYSLRLTLTNIVGSFTAGASATLAVTGEANQTVTVLAYDANNRYLEIAVPNGGINGVITNGDTISVGTNTAEVDVVERQLRVYQDKGSANWAAGDDIVDANTATVSIASVRPEYDEREYLPGRKWISFAPRPGTSLYAQEKGAHNDELHVLVLDVDGKISGVPYGALEKFIGLSKASDAKSTVGEANYYKTVIKNRSQYVYWGKHETTAVFTVGATAAAGDWGKTLANTTFNIVKSPLGSAAEPSGIVPVGSVNGASMVYKFSGGVNYTISNGNYAVISQDFDAAYNLVSDPEAESLDFVLSGPAGIDENAALAKANKLIDLVNTRKDCMAFFSPLRSAILGEDNTDQITENIVDYFAKIPSTSYAVLDSGYKYIYDKYNDVYRYVPCNGDVAGLTLSTAINAEPWFSPAGYTRGVLRNTIKLAYSPKKDQRDKLYSRRVNPIVTFPGQGTVLFGDKTALAYESAFNRINVRRLFIVIEKVISEAAKSILFEQNDEITRSNFINIVEPYMRDVQGRRGVTDYLIKCNSSNNPPDAVDRGEFYAEIFVKPTRTINYITLTFTATRTGVAFSEVAN